MPLFIIKQGDMMAFNFELGVNVTITKTGRSGVIQGRQEFLADENRYFVLSTDQYGRQQVAWWPESLLQAV